MEALGDYALMEASMSGGTARLLGARVAQPLGRSGDCIIVALLFTGVVIYDVAADSWPL